MAAAFLKENATSSLVNSYEATPSLGWHITPLRSENVHTCLPPSILGSGRAVAISGSNCDASPGLYRISPLKIISTIVRSCVELAKCGSRLLRSAARRPKRRVPPPAWAAAAVGWAAAGAAGAAVGAVLATVGAGRGSRWCRLGGGRWGGGGRLGWRWPTGQTPAALAGSRRQRLETSFFSSCGEWEREAGRRTGSVNNWLAEVNYEPPRVVMAIDNAHRTTGLLHKLFDGQGGRVTIAHLGARHCGMARLATDCRAPGLAVETKGR